MKKEDLKVGDKIWVKYGFSWSKAKIIHTGDVILFKLNWTGIISDLDDWQFSKIN